MNPLQHRPAGRRRFFAAVARWSAVLAFGVFAAWQEARRRRLAHDPKCVKLNTCRECVEFGRCTKPKARTARRELVA